MYKGSLKDQILNGTAKLESFYVTIGNDVYDKKMLESVSIKSDLLTSSTFEIGASGASTLEMTILFDTKIKRKPFDKYAAVRPWFRYLYEKEVTREDGSTYVERVIEDIPYGVYYIDSIDDTTKTRIEITASDALCNINRFSSFFVKDKELEYARDLIKRICKKMFIGFDVASLELIPQGFVVDFTKPDLAKMVEGGKATYRDILNMILVYSGVYGRMDREGNLTFFDIESTGITIDKSKYKLNSMSKGNIPFELAGLSCQIGDSVVTLPMDSPLENPNGTIILESPLLTAERIFDIFVKYQNFSYYPVSVDLIFNPTLDLGDQFVILDYNDNPIVANVFSYDFNYNGSFSLTIESEFDPVTTPIRESLYGALSLIADVDNISDLKLDTSQLSGEDLILIREYLSGKGYSMGEINAFLGTSLNPDIGEDNFNPALHRKVILENLENGVFIGNNLLPKIADCPDNLVSRDSAFIDKYTYKNTKDFVKATHMYSEFNISVNSSDAILNNIDLQYALSKLNKKERVFIKLRYFDEIKQEELAKRFNVSQVQISRLEKRIIIKLRKQLTNE